MNSSTGASLSPIAHTSARAGKSGSFAPRRKASSRAKSSGARTRSDTPRLRTVGSEGRCSSGQERGCSPGRSWDVPGYDRDAIAGLWREHQEGQLNHAWALLAWDQPQRVALAARQRNVEARVTVQPIAATASSGGRALSRALVLYWYPDELEMRLAVRQHLRALDDGRDKVVYHNAFQKAPPRLRRLAPDYVRLHPTFLGVRWNEDFARYRDEYAWLRELGCPKIALPQDEYDHSEILEDWLAELDATHIFSCFGAELRRLLYPTLDCALPFTETLTGFIDQGPPRAG